AQCKEWAGKYARKAAPITFNNATALLKNILSIAIEHRVIYANPAAVLRRLPLRPKEVKLPSIDNLPRCLRRCVMARAAIHPTERISRRTSRSPVAVQVKRAGWPGATLILMLVKLWYAATRQPERRIGNCAVCH